MFKSFVGVNMIIDIIKNIFFPFYEECLYCGKSINKYDEMFLCETCNLSLKPIDYACKVCSYPLSSDDIIICADCSYINFPFNRFVSGYLLDDLSKNIIHKYKYKHCRYLSNLYADMLLEVIEEKYLDESFDGLVYVPSTKNKIKNRGFDHILDIVKIISKNLDLKIFDIVGRKVHSSSQTDLTRKERKEQVKGNFYIKNNVELSGLKLLLIDDIYTTGATIEEVAKLFNDKGVDLYGATLFRTIKRED